MYARRKQEQDRSLWFGLSRDTYGQPNTGEMHTSVTLLSTRRRLPFCWLLGAAVLVACATDRTPTANRAALAITDSLQGLSGAQRDSLHHLGEGDEFLQVSWLKALTSVATKRPFLENIERFGMIADPADRHGLPIGLSALKPTDVGRFGEMVGFSCAACHTGQLTYQGKHFIIEGGAALVDAEGFERELLASMEALRMSPSEWSSFIDRVRAQTAPGDGLGFVTLPDLTSLLDAAYQRFKSFRDIEALLQRTDRTTAGYGRIDAFGTARNLLYPSSPIPMNAPVRFPVTFDAYRHTWLHWDANTNSVMERNIGQAIAAGAVVDFTTKRSTLLPLNLLALESLTMRVQPPRWPTELFGAIDTLLAAEGRVLYARECEQCHALRGQPERDTLIGYKNVGTDPQRATSSGVPLNGGQYAVIAGALLREVKDSAFRQHGISAQQQRQLEGSRADSKWRVTQAYAARPLTAIWSHPPYLHNGSVPTIRDLLLPPSQRPETFTLGHTEFDPRTLGLARDATLTAPPFLFDTRTTGNHNTGHLYGTTLTEAQRVRLLEYLKTF